MRLDKIKAFMQKLWEKVKPFFSRIPVELYPALGFALLTLLLMQSEVFRNFEHGTFDLRMRAKPKMTMHTNIMLLEIDEHALKFVGKWQEWRRTVHARALDNLRELGARHAIFDIEFTEKSGRTLTEQEAANFRRMVGVRLDALKDDVALFRKNLQAGTLANPAQTLIELQQVIDQRRKDIEALIGHIGSNDDLAFSLAIARFGKAIIPVRGEEYVGAETSDHEYVLNHYGLKPSEKVRTNGVIVDSFLDIPASPLHRTPYKLGFTNVDKDKDGTKRRIALFRFFRSRLFPQLAFTALCDILQVKDEDIEVYPGREVVFPGALLPGEKERRDLRIPVDKHCRMILNWIGPWSERFPHLSYADLFQYIDRKRSLRHMLATLDSNYFQGAAAIEARNAELERLLARKKAGEKLSPKEVEGIRMLEEFIFSKAPEIQQGMESGAADFNKQLAKLQGPARKQGEKQLSILTNSIQELKNELSAFKKLKTLMQQVRGATIIVGMTAASTTDLGAIPIQGNVPQVYVHANLLNTVLSREFIHRASPLADTLLLFALPLLFSIVSIRLRPYQIIILGVGMILAYVLLNFLFFTQFRMWVNMVGILFALLLCFISVTVLHYLMGEEEKKFIKAAFGHYLSPQVITTLLQNPGNLKLGGERKVLTAYFSDIQGFSTISETITPEELVFLLNDYLTEMTDIILQHQGTVDKFEGDAIIAFFGAPVPFEDHALRCCAAAIAMQNRIKEMRPVWKKRYGHDIYVRMGINTGPMVVGNMGSKNRFDYTMMGDSVNLASRLEGANKYYHTYTMISGSTYEVVKKDVETRLLDMFRVQGKKEKITVYELLALKGELSRKEKEKIKLFNEAHELYQAKDWKKARTAFRAVLKKDSGDGPSQAYVDRCSEFIQNPPPPSWDGVFTLKGK